MTSATTNPAFDPEPVHREGKSIWTRLSNAPIDDTARQWVIAALHGDDELAALTRGEPLSLSAPKDPVQPQARPRRSYLSRISVQGFRGIGPAAALEFQPGPGLTVIVGRNGSGKSSFAEAVEAALTGRNLRWEAMPTAWRDGWRNLHFEERTEIAVDLVLAGDDAPTRVLRTWKGDSIRSARGEVVRPTGATAPLRDLNWGEDLDRYRPFLSYDELGRAVTGRAGELYDTLTALLGLTGLAEAERRLAKTCDRFAKQQERPNRDLSYLLEQLRTSDDPRAVRAVELLGSTSVDLDRLASLAADDGPRDPGDHTVLRRLRRLSVPERAVMTDVVNELRGAAMELDMVAGTKGARARGIVELLQRALEHHERHPAEDKCPVCGHGDALNSEWAQRARAEIAALEPAASGASSAYERAQAAREHAGFLMAPLPSWLPPQSDLGQVWERWAAGTGLDGLGELADHIENVGRGFRSAASAARKAATERLADPTDGWADLAEQLGAWVSDARESMRSGGMLDSASRGLNWFTSVAWEIRQERLRPLAKQAEQVWQRLRQERHIDLEALRLVGRGAQRRVAVDVSVDGSETAGNSPGLLSQGEFQALALSICLPRTLIRGNPFGFLLLDDPVQAMDTETVEGLAAVLAEVGRHRQLVVFTHDTRLPDALNRLQLPATIRGIQRDAMSNVWMEG